MKFSDEQIKNFKGERRSYITWRKRLKPEQIKDFFYNSDDKYSIKDIFPGKDLEYCRCGTNDIVVGDFQLGVKYSNKTGNYYMFLGANSFWASPRDVAIGKAVDGRIYLIREHFPCHVYYYYLGFKEIPEEYINGDENVFDLRNYNHHIMFPVLEASNDITDEDVKCLRIAYEGVRAFSKLIEEID